VTAQIGHNNPMSAREVIDLVFPGLGTTGVTVHKHYGFGDTFRPDIDDTQIGISQPSNRDSNPVQIKIQLYGGTF
jgi:hypothetical protein